MKRLFFMLFLWLAFCGWIMFSPPEDAGYLLIRVAGKTVEMSLLLAALLAFTLLIAAWLLWLLLKGGAKVVNKISGVLIFGGERAQKRTTSGLLDFIEGNWSQAHKKLLRAAPKVEAPLVNYLAAARSAHELGDHAEATRILEQAAKATPDNELAIVLTRARIELLNQDYDQCLASLLKVKPLAPQNPVLLDLLRQVYLAQQDWAGLQGIYERLRSYKIISPAALAALEVQIFVELLKKEGAQAKDLPQAERLSQLKSTWQKVPANLHKDLAVLTVYVQQLAESSEDQEAELLIRKALPAKLFAEPANEWRTALVYCYGRVRGSDFRQQIRTAEEWLQQSPQDPTLLLTLGRLSMRNELWGKAREYYKASLSAKRDPETYAELARLLDYLGEQQQSYEATEQAVGLVVAALPNLPLPKKA